MACGELERGGVSALHNSWAAISAYRHSTVLSNRSLKVGDRDINT